MAACPEALDPDSEVAGYGDLLTKNVGFEGT